MSTHEKTVDKWYDPILNCWPLMIDDKSIHTFGVAWIFKEWYGWRLMPRITGDHQYYNAQFFIRCNALSLVLTLSFWIYMYALWAPLAAALALALAIPAWLGLGALMLMALILLSLLCRDPFALFFGMRLSAAHLLQIGIGWKQNGRFAIHLRHQTDESAARGTHSPNYGQASGWDYGEH